MTLAVAIWGAVLGTLSIVLQLVAVFRDRPALAVSCHALITRGGPYVLRIDVANRGSRATTLVEVGLEISGGVWTVGLDGMGDKPIIPIMRFSDAGEVRLLQPGEVASYEKTPTVALSAIDDPMRPYAIDSHGRVTWSRAQPFFRFFYEAGWRPKNEGTALTKRSERPLRVAPVAPVWQVWKPRPLRGSWRRRKDYGTQRWRRQAMRTALTESDPDHDADSEVADEQSSDDPRTLWG